MDGPLSNCQLEVKVQTTAASRGKANGTVLFEVPGKTRADLVIINISRSRAGGNSQSVLKSLDEGNLRAGTYEFMVVDKTQKECAKEVIVVITEQ
jgi:hypothetical protein